MKKILEYLCKASIVICFIVISVCFFKYIYSAALPTAFYITCMIFWVLFFLRFVFFDINKVEFTIIELYFVVTFLICISSCFFELSNSSLWSLFFVAILPIYMPIYPLKLQFNFPDTGMHFVVIILLLNVIFLTLYFVKKYRREERKEA